LANENEGKPFFAKSPPINYFFSFKNQWTWWKHLSYEKLCPWQQDYPTTRAPKQLIYKCIAIVSWKYDKLINKN
jgi:hypothetical protein